MKHTVVLLCAAAMCGCAANSVQPPPAPGLTIEQLIDIKHPSSPSWSPDGRHVAFVWDRAGVSNLYLADAGSPSGEPPCAGR